MKQRGAEFFSLERWSTGGVMGLAWLLLAVAGCEHRMSQDEFMVIEEEMRQSDHAQPATQPAAQQEVAALVDRTLGPYRIGPGDVLTVALTLFDQPTAFVPVQLRVNRDGTLDLPVVAAVKVADMELEEAEKAIKKAYVPAVFKSAAVYVTVAAPQTTEVLVLGAVLKPGLVELRRTELNLLQALAVAGGITDVAAGRVTLRRIRRPTEEVTLDLTNPNGLKAALSLEPLERGDLVSVQAKPTSVFVGGLVNAPHPVLLPAGTQLSVLQALASVGGLRTDVTPREATLIRRLSDGREVQVKLNLDRVTTGKAPNMTLAAGDILWVPDTLETRLQDWVNRNTFLRFGASATYNLTYMSEGQTFLNDAARQAAGAQSFDQQSLYDPFGSLMRNAALQAIQNRLPSAKPIQ
jgi:polysaccharide biosynthesis/export protein